MCRIACYVVVVRFPLKTRMLEAMKAHANLMTAALSTNQMSQRKRINCLCSSANCSSSYCLSIIANRVFLHDLSTFRNERRAAHSSNGGDSERVPGDTLSALLRASGVQVPPSAPRKRQCVGNNNRTQAEIWRERCQKETIQRDKAAGCSCRLRCVEKMDIGRIFVCRMQNSDRSSDQVRAEITRKLMSFASQRDGKFSYKTEDGEACCGVGFQVEQGVGKTFVSRQVRNIKEGAVHGAPRGGKDHLGHVLDTFSRIFI